MKKSCTFKVAVILSVLIFSFTSAAPVFAGVVLGHTEKTFTILVTNVPQPSVDTDGQFTFTASLNGKVVGSATAIWVDTAAEITVPIPQKSGTYSYVIKQTKASGNWVTDKSSFTARIKVTYGKDKKPVVSTASLKNGSKSAKTIVFRPTLPAAAL